MPRNKENRTTLDVKKMKIFAERSKILRTERGLTQGELGKCLGGLSSSTISGYELATRCPDLTVLSAYSEFFDVSIDYLVGDTEVRKTLFRVASSSDITAKDVGVLSEDAQAEIEHYIKTVLFREKNMHKGKK